MATTEYASPGIAPRLGPEMPAKRSEHCMVKLDESMALVTGGSDVSGLPKSNLWLYSIDDQEWNLGNAMGIPRKRHACGVLTDSR